MKKILIACQGGVATSTVARSRLKDILDQKGFSGKFQMYQSELSTAKQEARDMDVCLVTSQVPEQYSCPTYSGLPLLTEVGKDELVNKIIKDLWGQEAKSN